MFCYMRGLSLAVAVVVGGCAPPTPAKTAATAPGGPPPPPPSAAPLASAPQEPLFQQVQDDIRLCTNAAFSGDYETLFSFTHPKLLAAGGGKDKLLQTMQQQRVAETLSQGSLEELAFPAAPIFLKGHQHEFVVVPIRMRLAVAKQRVEATNYQLGVRSVGEAKWRYLDGARLDRGVLLALFPDFPADYEFPKRERKMLDAKSTP